MNYETMPFGKYKGVQIHQLETTYIVYALETFSLPVELKTEMGFVVSQRLNLKTIDFKSIYRELSKKYHPDKGGDMVAMQAINEYYSEINKALLCQE